LKTERVGKYSVIIEAYQALPIVTTGLPGSQRLLYFPKVNLKFSKSKETQKKTKKSLSQTLKVENDLSKGTGIVTPNNRNA
jgi:hypothetical protein